jgi:hypothetical protein
MEKNDAMPDFTRTRNRFVSAQKIAKIGGKTLVNRQKTFAAETLRARQAGVSRWYAEGGSYFYQWTVKNHRTNEGEPLRWDEPFAEEYYLLLGNPWVVRVIIEKAAQMGYSESLIALAGFLTAEIRIPSAIGFEVSSKVTDMVGDRIQPSFDYCHQIKSLRTARFNATGRHDTDSRTRKMTIGGVPLTFFYAGTKSTKANSPERQASSAMSSFTAWAILADEIELWPVGALDIAAERQSACPLPTKLMRGGSTPGQEGGIVDAQIKSSGYIFEWHLTCPNCGTRQAISAFGNLIKETQITLEDGSIESAYLDITGKPYGWFHSDDTDVNSRVKTAYVGCRHCEQELERETINSGHFETPTGLSMVDFLDDITAKRSPVHETVALRLPRLASVLFNAPERIRKLLTTLNPADQLQQGLGVAVSVGGGKISLPKMLDCVDRSIPSEYSNSIVLCVMGVDQGVAKNPYVVQNWYIPERPTWEERWLESFVEVVEYGNAGNFEEVRRIANKWGVHLIGIDADPERALAVEFARKNKLQAMQKVLSSLQEPKGSVGLFDQVYLKDAIFRRADREVQGVTYPVYSIDRTFGLDAVRNRIYRKLFRLQSGEDYRPGDNANFIYHFLTSDRKTDGKWTEPSGVPDHYFHAANFAEMVVLIADSEPTSGFAFTSIER